MNSASSDVCEPFAIGRKFFDKGFLQQQSNTTHTHHCNEVFAGKEEQKEMG